MFFCCYTDLALNKMLVQAYCLGYSYYSMYSRSHVFMQCQVANARRTAHPQWSNVVIIRIRPLVQQFFTATHSFISQLFVALYTYFYYNEVQHK